MKINFLTLNEPVINHAFEFALVAHNGQKNKFNGEPYIMHPMRVASMVAEEGYNEYAIAAALLHDVLEDVELSSTQYADFEYFPNQVKNAVDALTKQKGQTLDEYYRRILPNAYACIVKARDVIDNLRRISQVSNLDDRKRLLRKYETCLELLWENNPSIMPTQEYLRRYLIPII